jgi:hypothetical protein
MLSGFGIVTERDFVKIQIVWNSKEPDWAESVDGGVVNVLRSMNIFFQNWKGLQAKDLNMWPT